MARIIPGPIVSEITGRAGDVVFANLLGTPLVRARQKPYVSNTGNQQIERALFRMFMKAWSFSGNNKFSRFGTISLHQNKYPHAAFLKAYMRTFKYASQHPLFPTSNGLIDLQINNVVFNPDLITVSFRPSPNLIDALLQGTIVDNVGNVWNDAIPVAAGTASVLLFDTQLIPPVTIGYFLSTPSTIQPPPFTPQLWSQGICVKVDTP